MSGSGAKVSIPTTTRKMIQNIKEITGNHSEEEIYAMLKECSMDPNETAQKLLLQDTFHEVKRKRDRRKENIANRESIDSHWRTGAQGRGSRNHRVNFAPRYTAFDASGGKNSATGRDSGNNQSAVKGAGILLLASEEKSKGTTLPASCTYIVANGSSTVTSEIRPTSATSLISASGVTQQEVISSSIRVDKLGNATSPLEIDKISSVGLGAAETCGEPMACSRNSLVFVAPASFSTVCFSQSDPVLVATNDLRLPGAVGTIKWDVESHLTLGDSNTVIPAEKSAPEMSTSVQGKIPSKPHGTGKCQLNDTSQPSATSGHSGSFSGMPSSNYSNRSQQIVGPQKAGPNKEWKPKRTSSDLLQGTGPVGSSDVPNNPIEGRGLSQTASTVLDSEELISKLQKKLDELHLPPRQHVIIPNHIHVPESERTKLSFGSFDATFTVTSSGMNALQNDKSSTPISETSQVIEENVEEQPTSSQSALITTEDGAYPDNSHSPSYEPGNSCTEGDVSSSRLSEYNESKPESAFISGGHQYSVVHTSPGYNFGFIPPVISNQIAPFENSEPQARNVSRLPSFVVHQPFDPASYYAHFYRPGADNDDRASPFPSPGITPKYNGNVTVLPPHTTQSPQEVGNSLVLSTASPTPSATQTAGLMQSSIAVTQQPVPVFRPPTGLHISHYPPNYISYGHFFSPYYVPPPSIHQFLSNGAFPQQPQAGSLYPAPTAAAAIGVKYSLPQYKPGTNTGNSNNIGVPSGYGPYASSPTSYNPSSALTDGNSTTNEDCSAVQFKENNVYMTGQQSEGSAVWIAASGRDIPNLPASSFYNIPPQGQHVTFTPAQTGHGNFANMYHPAATAAGHQLLQQTQSMAGAIDVVGPASSGYQQPQHQQINWPSNY